VQGCVKQVVESSSGFGGWPNALQGLVSALFGGVIAALTAWWVVRLTHRHERTNAIYVNGLDSAVTIIERSHAFMRSLVDEDSSQRQRELALVSWAESIQIYSAGVLALDKDFDSRFQTAMTLARDSVFSLRNPGDQSRSLVAHELTEAVLNLADDLARWRLNKLGYDTPDNEG
jgi:hypothetical protein